MPARVARPARKKYENTTIVFLNDRSTFGRFHRKNINNINNHMFYNPWLYLF